MAECRSLIIVFAVDGITFDAYCDNNVKSNNNHRLALDGHLKLSINFVNAAKAVSSIIIPMEEETDQMVYNSYPDGELSSLEKRLILDPNLSYLNDDGTHCFSVGGKTKTLKGVFDLPMIGNERLLVEREYQKQNDGTEVTLQNIDGIFVETKDEQHLALLEYSDEEFYNKSKDSKNSCLARALPRGCTFVVRTSAMLDCIKRNNLEEHEPPPLSSETETEIKYLNIIIGVLLEVILGKSPGINKPPIFTSQEKLIEHFESFMIFGLRRTNLTGFFGKANRELKKSCSP